MAFTLSNFKRVYIGPVACQMMVLTSGGTADAITFTSVRAQAETGGYNRAFVLASTPINTGGSNAQLVPNATAVVNGNVVFAAAMAGGANTDIHNIQLFTW